MKSPYDAALRILHLEVDTRRAAIAAAASRAADVDHLHAAACERIRCEARLTSADWTLASPGYFSHARDERARLAGERVAINQQLQKLRELAAESYGSLRAVEDAADEYRAQAERQAALLEQTRIDDLVGARQVRAGRRPRLAYS